MRLTQSTNRNLSTKNHAFRFAKKKFFKKHSRSWILFCASKSVIIHLNQKVDGPKKNQCAKHYILLEESVDYIGKEGLLPYLLNCKVPLILPSGRICRYIWARIDHSEMGSRGLGGSVGRSRFLQKEAFTDPALLDGAELSVESTLPLNLCRFARGSDNFDKMKTIAARRRHALE